VKRPVIGRAGAGALIFVAMLALAQAVSATDAVQARAQVSTRATAAVHLRVPRFQAFATMPKADPPQPIVPFGRATVRVPILMYHYIRINPVPGDQLGYNLSVTPNDFRAQLDWLASNGYHPIDFNDLRAYYDGRQPLPSRPVIITLDDGYKDLYTTAYPIIRTHGFKAVAYIVFGFLGAPNNVTADQVREMDRNGIQIGAHTVSHVDLTKTSASGLQHEVADSRTGLEWLVGHPVLDFCYPSGRYDARVVSAVQAAGYQTATTTVPGIAHGLGDRFTWTRVRVSGGEGLGQFAANLGESEPTVMDSPNPNAKPHLAILPKLPLIFPLQPPLTPPPAALEQPIHQA
jgi:peptidoglycan/xylan/chitin deacetylase (PgdA/CDA1 family)